MLLHAALLVAALAQATGQTWTGTLTQEGWSGGTCAGTPMPNSTTHSAVAMSDGCACLSGTDSNANAWIQKSCNSCDGASTTSVDWTLGCNADCSVCDGVSGNTTYGDGVDIADFFTSGDCIGYTHVPPSTFVLDNGGNASRSYQYVALSSDEVTELIAAMNGCSPPPPPRLPPPDADEGSSSSNPCFADTTTACRIKDAATAPSIAFKQCFGDEAPTMAERVPMKALSAGDLVLASPTSTTRVLVNQHAAVEVYSNMVTLEHETGSLTLTPDHVVYADGAFQPAANVGVGALLEPASKVTKVSNGAHGIVNPLTTSGTILAAGPTGAPVVSSALSEWIADLVLESTLYPLPYSLAAAASYLFPHSVQAFYDAQLEPFFTSTSTHLKGLKAAVPAPVALAILAAVDAACVGAFAAWALFSLKGATALVAVAAVAKSRRVAKA